MNGYAPGTIQTDLGGCACSFTLGFVVIFVFLMFFAAIEAEKIAGEKTVQEVGPVSPKTQFWADGSPGPKQMIGLPASTPRGRPEDIASLVSFLAKPESRFLTGELYLLSTLLRGMLGFGLVWSWNKVTDTVFFLF